MGRGGEGKGGEGKGGERKGGEERRRVGRRGKDERRQKKAPMYALYHIKDSASCGTLTS